MCRVAQVNNVTLESSTSTATVSTPDYAYWSNLIKDAGGTLVGPQLTNSNAESVSDYLAQVSGADVLVDFSPIVIPGGTSFTVNEFELHYGITLRSAGYAFLDGLNSNLVRFDRRRGFDGYDGY
jgi:hypothetical protein